MGFHFICITWGELFTDLLLKLMLPNQLTEGNLGYFRDKPGSRYKIYTTDADARRMRAAPIFAKLEATIPVDLIVVPGLGGGSGHEAAYADMTHCHKLAIAEGERDGAAMLFLPGDGIWSEGSFRRLAVLCEAGYSAVLMPGIRLTLETYLDAFLSRYYDPDTMEAKVGARELVAHALPHLHPLMKAYFIDSEQFISFPSNLIVQVPNRGFLLRSFHLHPAIIKPEVVGGGVKHTIDYGYLRQACPDPTAIHVVEDSDEVLLVVVDREAHRSDLLKPNRFSLTRVARFAREHSDSYQQSLCVSRVYRAHADDPGPEWAPAERKISVLADRLRFALSA